MGRFKHFYPLLLLLTAFIPAAAFAAPSGTIVIGVAPEINLIKQMERYAPLAAYLEEKTGISIQIKPFSNFGQLYEEMRDNKIDAGFFGSLAYGIARARIGVEPLARTVQPNGKSTYTALLFASRDAGIKKPADMKGKTIALVDPATAAGYLAQREFLALHGIDMEKDLKIYWAGNHEAVIRAVLNHTAELGGAKSTVVAKFRKENKTFDTFVEILNESPKKGLPDNTFAVRKGLDVTAREKLKKTLLAMDSDPEGKNVLAKFGVLRFISTSDEDFKQLYNWCRHLNIDLTSYQYKKARQ